MRAAIFLGCIYIGDKIGVNELPEDSQGFVAWMFVLFIVMDVLEFFKKLGD